MWASPLGPYVRQAKCLKTLTCRASNAAERKPPRGSGAAKDLTVTAQKDGAMPHRPQAQQRHRGPWDALADAWARRDDSPKSCRVTCG
nr:unnamed protein product [Digitaria exilis]